MTRYKVITPDRETHRAIYADLAEDSGIKMSREDLLLMSFEDPSNELLGILKDRGCIIRESFRFSPEEEQN